MTHGLKGFTNSCCQFSWVRKTCVFTLLYQLSYKPVFFVWLRVGDSNPCQLLMMEICDDRLLSGFLSRNPVVAFSMLPLHQPAICEEGWTRTIDTRIISQAIFAGCFPIRKTCSTPLYQLSYPFIYFLLSCGCGARTRSVSSNSTATVNPKHAHLREVRPYSAIDR